MQKSKNLFKGIPLLLFLIFSMLFVGCVSNGKIITQVRDSSIPPIQHARLNIGWGAHLIHGFDESTSTITLAQQGQIVLIPPGTHSFYAMTKNSTELVPGSRVSTPYPGVRMTATFEPGAFYVLFAQMNGSLISYKIEELSKDDPSLTPDRRKKMFDDVDKQLLAMD
jgi:hypothetical protein